MKLKITVHGVAYEVEVEVLDAGEGFPTRQLSPLPPLKERGPSASVAPNARVAPPQAVQSPTPKSGAGGGEIVSPIAGNVLAIKCKAGDQVKTDQILLIIEAMKMETSIAAPIEGTVKQVHVAVGDAVRESQLLISLV
ncbi:acetyl-CoA carboxylase biotin carboxyl carrier protein subunit [bacterium]|nr:acetyl-CoA carboxylase biotin carboxyl carrier protein subunit [bacterium]